MSESRILKFIFTCLVSFLLSTDFAGAAYFEVVNSFDAPSPECAPAGLAWDGNYLWMTDSHYESQEVFKLTTDGTVIDSFDWPLIGGQGPSGITIDGDSFLRIAASTEQKIYKFNTGGNLESFFQTPIPGIRGVTWDGTNLWIAGGGWPSDPENVVHFYKMTIEGSIIDSFDLTMDTQFFRDITFDGANLWLVNQIGGEDTLFMISPEGDLLASYNLANDIGVPGNPRGLTWDGRHLWVACISPAVIYQLKPISPYLQVNAYIDVTTIPDINDNGFDDIACLAVDSDTGSAKVLIKDGETKSLIKSIYFFSFDISPKSMTVLPDMNVNDFPEIAVLGINKLTMKSILIVKDVQNKERISRYQFMGNNYVPSGITYEEDMDGNGMPEVTVIQTNRTTGRATALTRDALTGEVLRTINFPK